MKQVVAGNTFTLNVELTTPTTLSSFTPQVSIYTYASTGNLVDNIINSPFTSGAITNTNLKTMTSFSVFSPYTISNTIKNGYFGDLILNYDPLPTSVVSSGYYLTITLTSEFYPYSNQLGLPLSCRINSFRYLCTYTLAPFTVVINNITNKISTGNNVINITT
jgi:hypothetical protein